MTTVAHLINWRWLCDEVAFVAECVGRSEPAALEYILDRLHQGEIDWRYDKLEMHFRGGAAPESDWIRIGQLFFWRRYVLVKPHKIDLVNNSAERTGAAILGIHHDDKGNPQPIYKGRWSLTMRRHSIQLHHPTVVRYLQRSRFLLPPLSLVPGATEPNTPEAPETPPALDTPPAIESDAAESDTLLSPMHRRLRS